MAQVSARFPVAVGIDVAEERKGLDLVALDGHRHVMASAGKLSLDELTRMVLSQIHPTLVCIDAPSAWSTSGRSRTAERALRRVGITAFATGADPGDHPFYRWMRVGFSIYQALSPAYRLFRGGDAVGTAAEVFPEASAVLLAGRHRDPDETKITFRRHVLRAHGVDDAVLPTVDRVDAALAALTGVLALEGTCTNVGDPDEGVIMLPVATLPASPLVRTKRRPRRRAPGPPARASGDPTSNTSGRTERVPVRPMPGLSPSYSPVHSIR
jgi:predicted nuclease with RNAse H fold